MAQHIVTKFIATVSVDLQTEDKWSSFNEPRFTTICMSTYPIHDIHQLLTGTVTYLYNV